MLDLNAPILPWVGLANITLYTHISTLKTLIARDDVKSFLFDKFLVRYEIEDELFLFFNLLNGKLFKITALKNYTGCLFDAIKIGTSEADLLKADPSFEYDDFEEVYVSEKGVFIETNPETDKISYISVFIKELETEEFMEGKW